MTVFAEVQKTFGAHGELLIKLRNDAPDELNLDEPVFITMDGLPVPFYFKRFEPRGNNRALILFDDFETQRLAEELVGKKLALTANEGSPSAAGQCEVINYTVQDKQQGEIGAVTGFLDIPGNPCLQVDYSGREIIIPFHSDIVQHVDNKQRMLQVVLPEGLLEL